MAIDPTDLLRPAPGAEEAPGAPLAGTRSQWMQRLQVGLSGLAAMVLLVGLADIISANLQRNEARVVPESAPADEDQPDEEPARDPLADAGVMPEVPADPARRGGRAVRAAPPAQTGDASPETR